MYNNQQLANATKCLVQQMHVIIGGVNSKAVNMKFPIRIKLNNESCRFMRYELRVLSNVYKKRESKFDDWEYFNQNTSCNDYEQLLTFMISIYSKMIQSMSSIMICLLDIMKS